MGQINKDYIAKAKEVFDANPDINKVSVAPNTLAFISKGEAERYSQKFNLKGDVVDITRADVYGDANADANDAPAKEGYAALSHPQLKALVKERNLVAASQKAADLIAALEAADIAAAETAANAEGEGEGEGENQKTEDQA